MIPLAILALLSAATPARTPDRTIGRYTERHGFAVSGPGVAPPPALARSFPAGPGIYSATAPPVLWRDADGRARFTISPPVVVKISEAPSKD